MSNIKINAALSARLAALMPAVPTEYENLPFTPPAGVTYLSETFLPATSGQEGLASGSFSERIGIYQVLVRAPKDATKGPRAVAEAVCAQFPKGLRLNKDGITVAIVRVAQSPALVSNDRWIVPVSIYYRAMA